MSIPFAHKAAWSQHFLIGEDLGEGGGSRHSLAFSIFYLFLVHVYWYVFFSSQVDKYLKEILQDVISNLTNTTWRVRESRYNHTQTQPLCVFWRHNSPPNPNVVIVFTHGLDMKCLGVSLTGRNGKRLGINSLLMHASPASHIHSLFHMSHRSAAWPWTTSSAAGRRMTSSTTWRRCGRPCSEFWMTSRWVHDFLLHHKKLPFLSMKGASEYTVAQYWTWLLMIKLAIIYWSWLITFFRSLFVRQPTLPWKRSAR